MIYNLGRVLTKPMTVQALSLLLGIQEIDKPNLRAALNSAVNAGLATKTKRRIGGKLIWVYRWDMK
jgi:hypothetical protein